MVADGSMSTAARRHTATLLPDGRVLVTGGDSDGLGLLGQCGALRSEARHVVANGCDEHGPLLSHSHTPDRWSGACQRRFPRQHSLGSAEIYDPALGTWSSTPSMSTARADHTATLLQDGRVLVSGGRSADADANTSASAEIYDPALGTWSQTGSMTAERELHTATLLLDGRVLVSGGFASYFYDDGDGGLYYSGFPMGKRGDLRSGFGNLVGDRLDARVGARLAGRGPAPSPEHAAIRRPGARQRRLPLLLSRPLFGQRGNLQSGARDLVADGCDEHAPSWPHRHVATRRASARQWEWGFRREHHLGERGDLFAWRRQTRRRRHCHAPRRTARGTTAMSPLHAPQVISNRVSRTRRMRAFTSPPMCRPGRRRPAPPRTAARSVTSWVTAVRLLLSPGTRWTRRRRRSRSRCRWRVRHTV